MSMYSVIFGQSLNPNHQIILKIAPGAFTSHQRLIFHHRRFLAQLADKIL